MIFGKHSKTASESDKFVMAAGRKVGNLKPPMAKPAKTSAKAVEMKHGKRSKLGAVGDVMGGK
jgi:hypothetical protein